MALGPSTTRQSLLEHARGCVRYAAIAQRGNTESSRCSEDFRSYHEGMADHCRKRMEGFGCIVRWIKGQPESGFFCFDLMTFLVSELKKSEADSVELEAANEFLDYVQNCIAYEATRQEIQDEYKARYGKEDV